MFARLTIIGNIGGEPEEKTMGNGEPMLNFSVAVSGWSKDGTKQPDWYRCTAFRSVADRIKGKISKGTLVVVEGTPSFFEKKDGSKAMSVTVSSLNVVSRPGGSGSQNQNPATKSVWDDEIPF